MQIEEFNSTLMLHQGIVKAEWVDEYDHMNLSFYVWICDQSTYAFWELINNSKELEQRGGLEYAVVESHVNYLRELRLGDPVRVTTQLLAYDSKRFRLFHELYHETENFLSATNEIMALGFDLNARSISEFDQSVQSNLAEIYAEHQNLAMPKNAGKAIAFTTPD